MTGRVRAGQGRFSISRDPQGNPVMQRDPNGSIHYFELDRQGSVMGTTGTDRRRTSAFHYTPYGSYDVRTGPHSGAGDNFIGFQGGFFHSTPAYTKFGHRWYNPTVGSFTQPDPIGTPGSSGTGQDNRSGIGGPYSTELNAFGFANGDPCNNSDPSGLISVRPCTRAGTIAGVAAFVGAGAIAAIGYSVSIVTLPTGFGVAGFVGTTAAISGLVGAGTGCLTGALNAAIPE